jgi:hypothetical protein
MCTSIFTPKKISTQLSYLLYLEDFPKLKYEKELAILTSNSFFQLDVPFDFAFFAKKVLPLSNVFLNVFVSRSSFVNHSQQSQRHLNLT